jgi:hypothetical protein
MTTPPRSPAAPTTFTPAQWHALRALRTRYHLDRDLWSERERAHLHFLRWIYQSGRLAP